MMGMDIFSWKTKCRRLPIFFAIIFILSTKGVMQNVEGRAVVEAGHEMSGGKFGSEKIGSAPPRCYGKCSWCGHCEAIQVPASIPQTTKIGMNMNTKSSPTTLVYNTNTVHKNDDYSNYKPLSWKCKCGKFIFNP